jgi:hypothetical protein
LFAISWDVCLSLTDSEKASDLNTATSEENSSISWMRIIPQGEWKR